MKSSVLGGVGLAIAITTAGAAQVQQVSGGRAPVGGRTLVAMNFAGTPVGDFPAGIEPNTGNLEVVDKNGQRMLRATTESSFIVNLPELLPQNFLLEFELIPKSGHGGYDFTVEGTKDIDQGSQSIHLYWHSTNVRGVGGGGTGGFDAPMPEAVRVGLAGAPTTVVVSVQDQRIQFFANGTLTHTLPNRRFARSKILRVALGGENEDDGAVYLSSFRVAAMGAATNVATNQNAMTGPNGGANINGGGGTPGPGSGSNTPGGSGSGTGASNSLQPNGIANLTVTDSPAGPVATWLGVPGATYLVQRWLVADPACCASSSPAIPPLTSSPWQDTPLPVNGTYMYSVTATTSTGNRTSQVPFSYTSASASGRAMPTSTTAPSFSPPATPTSPTTTSVQVPTSSGAISSSPAVAVPATTSGTAPALPPPPAGAAATFPAPTAATTTTPTNPSPPAGVSGGAGSTGGVSGGSNMFPTGSTGSNTTHSATSVAATGRYRVTLTGARAYQPTLEVQTGPDGAGDEVYASAAVIVWNRTTQTGQSQGIVKTLEYGEVPNAQLYPNRIQVGTVTAYGGIRGTELIPQQFDPMGATTTMPPVTTDRFPLLLWEGALTDGVDAVLVVPTLWDRDLDPSLYVVWRNAWQSPTLPRLFATPELQNLLAQGVLTSPALTIGPAVIAVPPPELTVSVKDHPIGLTPKPTSGPPAFADYQDRFVMITREKLTQLQVPGAYLTLPISYVEPQSPITRASYQLYLRIERVP